MSELPLLFAFLAGTVSFLAPCVLPLLPPFIAYLAGATVAESTRPRLTTFLNAMAFVIGFSAVFSLLGILLNTVLEAVAYDAQIWLARIGGLVIIFFGLYLTGLFRIPFFEREHKLKFTTKTGSRYLSSFLFGAAFAAGWTPCAGPALGGILGLATTQPGAALPLLLGYSLGFGIPFLIISLGIGHARGIIHRLLPYIKILNVVFGVLLIIFGLLIFTQTLQQFANFDFITNWLSA